MKKLLLTLAFGGLMAASASAAPITFSNTFSGQAIVLPSNVGATSVTFNNFSVGNQICSISCTDVDFNTGTMLTSGNAEIFEFVTTGANVLFTTNTPWSVQLGPNDTRVINLFGNYSRSGSDTTAGYLVLTYQASGPGNLTTFSASGSTVPEPGSMALLGSGLLGLGLVTRRRLQK